MKFIFNNYEKIKLTIFILLIVSLPFYHLISSVLIIIVTLITILRAYPFKHLKIASIDGLSIILICYFILELIGMAYTDKENVSNGLFNIEKHLSLLFIPLIFFDFKINAIHKRIILLAFSASCFIASLMCVIVNINISLIEYNTFMHEWRFSHSRLSEPIGIHPAYFSIYLGLSVLIILNELKEKISLFSSLQKTFTIFILFCFFIMIVALGSRTVTVALVAIIFGNMIVYAFSQKSYKILIVSAIVPLIFMGFVLINPVVKTRFIDIKATSYNNSNYGGLFARTKIWEPGMELIKENLWLGVGTGDDQTELDKKFIKYNYWEGVQAFNMHNQFLQTALNYGIVGLLLLLIVLFLQLKNAVWKRDLLYFSFLMLFICACLTESMLSRSKGIIFFLIFSFIFYKPDKPSLVSREE
jgi:O-antigen ligase